MHSIFNILGLFFKYQDIYLYLKHKHLKSEYLCIFLNWTGALTCSHVPFISLCTSPQFVGIIGDIEHRLFYTFFILLREVMTLLSYLLGCFQYSLFLFSIVVEPLAFSSAHSHPKSRPHFL